MARVVQRRSNPPILLIVFVILFVIATIVAVIGFVQRDEWEAQSNDQKALVKERDKQIKTLKKEKLELIYHITGERTGDTTGTAIKKADTVYASGEYKSARDIVGDEDVIREGLVKDIEFLSTKVKAKNDRIATLDTEVAGLKDQLVASKQLAAAQIQKDKQEIAKFVGRVEKLNSAINAKQGEYDKAISEFSSELSSLRGKSRTDTRTYDAKLEKVILELHQRKKAIKDLQDEIAELNRKLRGTDDTAADIDGKVYKVLADAGVCYINLGAEDNVREGMAFAVFAPDAAKGAERKASLRAINVNSKTTECKIVDLTKDMVVSIDDEVANLAYDPARRYQFVVKGSFDLHGTGKSTTQAANELKQAIKLHGGTIGDDVTVQTDYVVLGVEPIKPLKPAEDAPASVQRSYEKQLKLYNDFFGTKKKAESMRIPVLNTNRFLDLTGYMPEKNPEE